MQTYKQFQPTAFDVPGLGLKNRQDWFVVPCSQTRDSDALDRSNFAVALAILGGESETCEVHRFGHWGPGWFELILIAPEREQEGTSIESALADYPVLSDSHYTALEAGENEYADAVLASISA